VIVENAGFGSAAAAPIARRVFDYLLAGLWPNAADMAATREGRSSAPMGVPRRAADVTMEELGLPAGVQAPSDGAALGIAPPARTAPLRLAAAAPAPAASASARPGAAKPR
jgi:penicillin-binding protein 2